MIREATRADREILVRIARASFDRVYAFFAARGLGRANPLLVAEEDGVIVGFLEGILFDGPPPIGYVYFVAVDPGRRGRGNGKALVSEALRVLQERRATRVFAAVPDDNEASRKLFESLGFTETSRRALRRWYGWRGVAVQMRMVIAPHEVLLVRTFTDLPQAQRQNA